MMVHYRKRFSKKDLYWINELIAETGIIVIDAAALLPSDEDSDDLGTDSGQQLVIYEFVKLADWAVGKSSDTLTIVASFIPADITYTIDLKFLNVAREFTERIIDDLCHQRSDLRKHRPRYVS